MDFSKLKEKFSSFKSDSLKLYNETVEKTAKKLIESNFTIKTLFELEDFIGKSKNYFSESSNKEETKRIICIFASKESDFFKKFLYELPVIYTKAWARNIGIKLVESSLEGLELSKYQIVSIPSLVLFENEKVVKVVATEEKINKIVKSLTLDIEKTIKDIDDTKKEVSPVSTNQSNIVVTSEVGSGENITKTEENLEVKTPEVPQNNTNNIINDSDIISEISK
ncbi:MAG: hypothetical protein WC850_03145 [Candidatus Gracilibacteria bacterium]